jgi:hypothetical protein
MTHLASINVPSRRALASNAVLCSFYFRTSQIVSMLPSTCTVPPHPAPSPAFCLLHFSRKNNRYPRIHTSKSHRQARIHHASGSLQTALS